MPSHTPEEKKKRNEEADKKAREDAGNQFIRDREKNISRGAGKREAAIAAGAGQTIPKQGETGQRTVEETIQATQDVAGQLEEAGVLDPVPTSPKKLVAPSGSLERETQIEEAIDRETFIADFIEGKIGADLSPDNPLGDIPGFAIVDRAVKDLTIKSGKQVDKAVILLRAGADAVGDVPFVGDLVTSILGNRSEIVNNVKASLDKRKEIASDVASDVESGFISVQDAFAQLDQLEIQLNDAENMIQQQAILSKAVQNSGVLIDIEITMFQQRRDLQQARLRVAEVALTPRPEPDLESLAFRLDQLS